MNHTLFERPRPGARLLVYLGILWAATCFMAEHARADCVGCHADKTGGPVVHAAVQAGCDSCHIVPHDEVTGAFPKGAPPNGLIATGAPLCFSCHLEERFRKPTVHAPVKAGQCTSCHVSHSGDNLGLLQKAIPELCRSCHSVDAFQPRRAHGAGKVGTCNICHASHASTTAALLVSPVPALCNDCHDPHIFEGAVVHGPVAVGDCSACHRLHADHGPGLLDRPVPELCLKCHGAAGPGRVPSREAHERSEELADCLRCHEAHTSVLMHLLKYPQAGPEKNG